MAELEIVELTMGPVIRIMGSPTGRRGERYYVPCFPGNFPYQNATDSRAEAERQLERLQQLEARSLLGWY